ncbi:hypothetical protein EVG20_g4396 [Dentipellis fragilis]|uniref:Uncharacterized protein n=1 Tax=Dentipellis fragilis TaxID=205917 RepID=A0A4Y9YWL1_9AGAM|nr:hypothetical protein EVG20_g4396 [Dentipellis fragilis]
MHKTAPGKPFALLHAAKAGQVTHQTTCLSHRDVWTRDACMYSQTTNSAFDWLANVVSTCHRVQVVLRFDLLRLTSTPFNQSKGAATRNRARIVSVTLKSSLQENRKARTIKGAVLENAQKLILDSPRRRCAPQLMPEQDDVLTLVGNVWTLDDTVVTATPGADGEGGSRAGDPATSSTEIGLWLWLYGMGRVREPLACVHRVPRDITVSLAVVRRDRARAGCALAVFPASWLRLAPELNGPTAGRAPQADRGGACRSKHRVIAVPGRRGPSQQPRCI